ncbi:4'-phosphopantetheinyl transferase superfamily protein [Clostridium sp. 'deep sea']|uniref:4'-phosphopantetheinyl transferase family protein n=1 Tax=Clostridium sp. 'deep sea' TaxID=2779445 RepID=UPI0018969C0A|nr:4'-phosphopantetheinyl transferase superfamily protein [Clostridium sp. 'deep sea']QOR35245.1 4'-phosphopantetheinyl transferase superfamily protein [Clostridium sp. 'deep sea']
MKTLILTKIKPIDYKDLKDVSRFISEERLARAELFTDNNRKNEFITVEIAASYFVSEVFNISLPKFNGKAGEKPYLCNYPNISVSRSYADNYVVFALENNFDIGVDCEKIKSFDKNTLKYFFTEQECRYINDSKCPNLAYAIIWTRKESYLKCTGQGLAFALSKLDVTPQNNWVNSNSRYPIYKNNDQVKSKFINSYIYNDLVISLCSTSDNNSPTLTLQVKNMNLGV